MIAERIKLSELSQTRPQTLMALFAQEAAANEFVARLRELGIELRGVTIIGVALGEPSKRLSGAPKINALNSSRYTKMGVMGGSFIALLIGLVLYAANFLHLSLLEALLVHTLALVILGGVIGGAIGAILASVQAQNLTTTLPPQNTEGFLVVIKTSAYLIAQCEAIAREAGAKKAIS